MKKLRILQIGNLGYEAGGAEKSMLLISQGLRARGHDVRVVSTDKNPAGKPMFVDETIPGIQSGGIMKFIRYTWYGAGRKAVKRIADSYQPDIVHIHTIGEFSPSILWAFKKSVPVVMTVHGPEGFTLKLLPWQLLPTDYKNSSYQKADLRLIGRLRYLYFRCVQRPLYIFGIRRLRKIIAPSKYMAEILKFDSASSRIVQLYNGIELPKPRALAQNNSILYVGRLEAVKGIEHVVRAMPAIVAKIPTAKLTLVGDGSDRQRLMDIAQELGVADNVHFAGWVNATDVPSYIEHATAFVIPSVWPENLPTVAIEALAVGRPILASRVGGIPELVQDGVNGYLISPGDVSSIAAGIFKILESPRQAKAMAKASTELSKNFDIDTFVDKLEALYREVASL